MTLAAKNPYEDGKVQVEQILDRFDIETITEMLRDICYEKAEHICANWQDDISADAWSGAGDILGRALAEMGGNTT